MRPSLETATPVTCCFGKLATTSSSGRLPALEPSFQSKPATNVTTAQAAFAFISAHREAERARAHVSKIKTGKPAGLNWVQQNCWFCFDRHSDWSGDPN